MRWVEIINVMVNEDGFVLVIKDGTIIGLKYFDVDFCKNVNLEDNASVQKLCLDIILILLGLGLVAVLYNLF